VGGARNCEANESRRRRKGGKEREKKKGPPKAEEEIGSMNKLPQLNEKEEE